MSSKIQIAVCDDESMILRVIAETIRDILKKKNRAGEIETFSSPTSLLRAVDKRRYELLFLDIDMPELDGISVVKKLQEKQKESDIIFVSNREDKVFDSLSVHPFGFVRKSVFLKDIDVVLEEWLAKRDNLSKLISLQVPSEGVISIPIKDIVYIEGCKKDQIVHINKRNPVEVRTTMDLLEEKLKSDGFIRCHKGFLVNCGFISIIRYELIVEMRTGEKIPVSRARLQMVKDAFLDWIENNGVTTID